MLTHAHTYIHTYTHTYTQTCTQIYTDTHTHTHAPPSRTHLSAKLDTHASDASAHEAPHSPAGSSLPSQQSHTPSPTLDDGSRTDRCPRLAHSKAPVGAGGRRTENKHDRVRRERAGGGKVR